MNPGRLGTFCFDTGLFKTLEKAVTLGPLFLHVDPASSLGDPFIASAAAVPLPEEQPANLIA